MIALAPLDSNSVTQGQIAVLDGNGLGLAAGSSPLHIDDVGQGQGVNVLRDVVRHVLLAKCTSSYFRMPPISSWLGGNG